MKSKVIINKLDLKRYEIEEMKRMLRNREEKEDEEIKEYKDINFILRKVGRMVEEMGEEVNKEGASIGDKKMYKGYLKLMLEIRKEKKKIEINNKDKRR